MKAHPLWQKFAVDALNPSSALCEAPLIYGVNNTAVETQLAW